MNSDITRINEKIRLIPTDPGVYIYKDKNQQFLYVGKAKNLRKRVLSYFSKNQTGKTQALLSKVADIEYLVVDSESDALLLENSLVKKHQPRYNILLKDDKSFPWICVKNEPFPRVFSTRNKFNDGSEYFGPYTSMVLVRTLLNLIRQLYPLRNCRLNLSPDKIKENKYKVCLEYHLGNCLAPCIGLQNETEYNNTITQIKSILKGNLHDARQVLLKLMEEKAREFQYEEANLIKEKIEILEKYQSKSTVVSARITNLDVYSIIEEGEEALVNYLRIIKGSIVQSHTIILKKKLDETKEDLLLTAIMELRQRFQTNSRETIVPVRPSFQIPDTRLVVPQKGDKKKLLELSERNLQYFRLERLKAKESFQKNQRTEKVLEAAQKDLRLKAPPKHIECFDNSNIQGSNPVAACVVFRNAKPSKKEYRHFNIKTVTGINDVASMEEVVYRRYKRLTEEHKSLPDALFVDGGKGQLNAAIRSLEKLGLRGKIPVFGIAKRLEEIYFSDDPVPLYIDKNSTTLKLIQNLRNEAHRFGLDFHKQKRSKDFVKSELFEIPGIGQSTIEKLLKEFKSVSRIRKLQREELEQLLGPHKARKILDYLKSTPD